MCVLSESTDLGKKTVVISARGGNEDTTVDKDLYGVSSKGANEHLLFQRGAYWHLKMITIVHRRTRMNSAKVASKPLFISHPKPRCAVSLSFADHGTQVLETPSELGIIIARPPGPALLYANGAPKVLLVCDCRVGAHQWTLARTHTHTRCYSQDARHAPTTRIYE